jgi:uncharacterized membrane protein
VPAVRQVEWHRPLRWLAAGWRDFLALGFPSAMHGLMTAFGGLMIVAVTLLFWPLMPGAVSGFVLVGPILATGLYELSRVHATGRETGLADVFGAWRRGTRPLVWLGILLLLAATAWVVASTALFSWFVRADVHSPMTFLRYALVGQGNGLFLLWLLLGGLGASLVFAVTAVSPPLLLEREMDLRTAILASVRAVGDNPVAMGFWATLIMLAAALSIALGFLGFIVSVPVIGHATWHACRDLVDADDWPARR